MTECIRYIYYFDTYIKTTKLYVWFLKTQKKGERKKMSYKKDILLSYLNEGKTMIVLDSRKEGVELPPHLMNLLQVKLNLSYRFANKIFEITDDQIKVNLSFGGKTFTCVIPMDAIYYIALYETSEGTPFLEDMPEIFVQMAQELDDVDFEDLEEKDMPNSINFLANIPPKKSKEIVQRLAKKQVSPKKPKPKR